MELREWLIILGLALVSLIVIDGIRRLKRQRRVPRLDQADAADSGMDPEEAKREAELSWELPNGGARVIKSADYSNLTGKPKLERQEHPGPSRVLSEFRRDKSASAAAAEKQRPSLRAVDPAERTTANTHSASAESASVEPEEKRASEVPPLRASTAEPAAANNQAFTRMTAIDDDVEPASSAEPQSSHHPSGSGQPESAPPESAQSETNAQHEAKRRQLRSSTVGDYSDRTDSDETDNDEEDTSYQLVDFHGIKDSFKHRMQERLEERKQKKLDKIKRKEQLKAEKAERAIEAEKLKAQRAAEEAERRREAQLHADASRAEQAARKAQEQRELHQTQGDRQSGFEKYNDDDRFDQPPNADLAAADYGSERYAHNDNDHYDDGYASEGYASDYYDDVVRPHPTLAKAMRNDVSGKHAADTLQNAEEVVVISVMSRDEDGFEGDKLLELLMMCGLRYSSDMGVFHRLETEHPESELQFSMVNVVKPGTFPIQEMDTFVTPGITFLMPLPGAEDSSAAFEAMVETAMVVVRHMGGELKDENRSVMTAQTIEFARQRVHEFERRHHLHRVQAN
ncbi:cell division protein ZipA [Halomonas sp. CH40]